MTARAFEMTGSAFEMTASAFEMSGSAFEMKRRAFRKDVAVLTSGLAIISKARRVVSKALDVISKAPDCPNEWTRHHFEGTRCHFDGTRCHFEMTQGSFRRHELSFRRHSPSFRRCTAPHPAFGHPLPAAAGRGDSLYVPSPRARGGEPALSERSQPWRDRALTCWAASGGFRSVLTLTSFPALRSFPGAPAGVPPCSWLARWLQQRVFADKRNCFIQTGSEARERECPMAPAETVVDQRPSAFRGRSACKHSNRIVERECEKVVSSHRHDCVFFDFGPRD
jgi:hypothetical protein